MEPFLSAYKAFYKAISAPEVEVEDSQGWMEITVNACKAIEVILTHKNLPRNKSLETSLGQFIGIQLALTDKMKQCGELAQENSNLEGNAASSNSVSEKESDSSEIESVKWSEVDSALENRIQTGVIMNIKHLR